MDESNNTDLLKTVIDHQFEHVRFLAVVERAAVRSGNSQHEEVAHARLISALVALRRMLPGLPSPGRWTAEDKVKALELEVMQ